MFNPTQRSKSWQTGDKRFILDNTSYSPTFQFGNKSDSPLGIPGVPIGSNAKITAKTNPKASAEYTCIPFILNGIIDDTTDISRFFCQPCFSYSDEREPFDIGTSSLYDRQWQRTPLTRNPNQPVHGVHESHQHGWSQYGNATIMANLPTINRLAAYKCEHWLKEQKMSDGKTYDDDIREYPTAAELARMIRPIGVCNTQASAKQRYSPDVRVFVLGGSVECYQMWSFGDPDRPNLKLMPGLVLYFGWRMRRVRKEGETGPVQLGFRLTQTGNPYNLEYHHDYVWELLPFVMEPGSIPDIHGPFPTLVTNNEGGEHKDIPWITKVEENTTYKIFDPATNKITQENGKITRKYYPYWMKVGTIWDFRSRQIANSMILGNDICHDLTLIEKLPTFAAFWNFNGAQSFFIQ